MTLPLTASRRWPMPSARLSMDAVQAANSGHPGMPMGMADVATVLYSQIPEVRSGRARLG